MKSATKLVFLFDVCLTLISARRVEFYRRDYTYVGQFDAYYKAHWSNNGNSWNTAFQTCDEEGATLFYPKLSNEWHIASNLTRSLKETPNVTDIFVGIHDRFGVGEFMTVDGNSFDWKSKYQGENKNEACVTMNMNNGEYRAASCVRFPYSPLPFICKKNDDEYCPTIDPDYKYVKSLKKCYKINRREKTWDDAIRSCYMEGGILIVLQNEVEADIIKDLIETNSKYHTGIKRIHYIGESGDFYTITGQNMDKVYNKLNTETEDDEDFKDCGTLYYYNNEIYIRNIKCDIINPFICEMNVQ